MREEVGRRPPGIRALEVALLGASLAFAAQAGEGPADLAGLAPTYEGTLFAPKSQRTQLLYRWEQWESRDGARRLGRFFLPDGTLVARQEVTLEAGRFERYRVWHPLAGQHGEVARRGDWLVFSYTKHGRTRTRSEPFDESFVVGPMLVPFAQAHWNALRAGKKLEIRLAIADRVQSMPFTLRLKRETVWEGKPALVVRLEAGSFLVRRFVDPIDLTFSADGRDVWRVVGRTIPLHREGNAWRPTQAEAVYRPARAGKATASSPKPVGPGGLKSPSRPDDRASRP